MLQCARRGDVFAGSIQCLVLVLVQNPVAVKREKAMQVSVRDESGRSDGGTGVRGSSICR